TAAALEVAPHLSVEQRSVVETLTTTSDGVALVIAAAGTGKTTTLATAADAWHRQARTGIGAPLAGRPTHHLPPPPPIPPPTPRRVPATQPPQRRPPHPPARRPRRRGSPGRRPPARRTRQPRLELSVDARARGRRSPAARDRGRRCARRPRAASPRPRAHRQ